MEIYVINSDSRTDRLQHMQRSLTKYSFQRIEEVESVKLNLNLLHQQRWFPERSWLDPILQNPIKYTEIAKLQSHYQCWEKIVATNQSALILEDDINLLHVLGELKLDNYQNLLINYDILYLSYKEMQPNQSLNIDDQLLHPCYPYLSCAYCLNPHGAKKLLASPCKNHALPIDEYLAIMIGCEYFEYPMVNQKMLDMLETFRSAQKLNAAAFAFPHVKQILGAMYSYTNEDERTVQDDQVNHFITIGTDIYKTNRLFKSADKFNIPLQNIGAGVEWQGGTMQGPGGGQKVNLIKKYLDENTFADELVLFMDGYDVIINDDIAVVFERFYGYECDILFAAEKTCWPDSSMAEQFPDTGSSLKYLNSGIFIGKASALKKIFNQYIDNSSDDQLYLQQSYLNQQQLGVNIKLDATSFIFSCISEAEESIDLYTSGQFVNYEHNVCFCILHGNGGASAKEKFYALADRLGFTE